LELWAFLSFSSHTIVTWSFEFFSFSSHTIVTWSFEIFFLFLLASLSLGALNFSFTHKPFHMHWKLQAHENNAKPKLGMKLIFISCYFHFYILHTLLWFHFLLFQNWPCSPPNYTLWITLF
jgi:hypothetical protein